MAGQVEEPLDFHSGFIDIPNSSISFGRFEEDSLSWERRSSFSHNRYLEEAEKYAKRGSVTEKKAYFEAHFKRKAQMLQSFPENQEEAEEEFRNFEVINNGSESIQNGNIHATQSDVTHDGSEERLNDDSYDDEVNSGRNIEKVVNSFPSEIHSDPESFDFVLDGEIQPHLDSEAYQVHAELKTDEAADVNSNGAEISEESMLKLDSVEDLVEEKSITSTKVKESNKPTSKVTCITQRNQTPKGKEKVPFSRTQHSSSGGRPVDKSNGIIGRRKAPEVQKVSTERRVPRKTIESPRVNTKYSIESAKLNVSRNSDGKLYAAFSSAQKKSASIDLPKTKELLTRTSPKPKDLTSKGIKPEVAATMKVKPSQHVGRRDKNNKDGKAGEFNDLTGRSPSLAHLSYSKLKDADSSNKVDSRVNEVGFKFRSEERAEKRKQFYEKLEDKMHAKEMEMNQIQAKSQKETEVEMKQIRRSLNFRAAPLPSFYHGASPKASEAKKGFLPGSMSPNAGTRRPASSSSDFSRREKPSLHKNVFASEATNISEKSVLNQKLVDDAKLGLECVYNSNNSEPEGPRNSFLSIRPEDVHKQKGKIHVEHRPHSPHYQVLNKMLKGDKTKLLKEGKGEAKAMKQAVGRRSGVVPITRGVAVFS